MDVGSITGMVVLLRGWLAEVDGSIEAGDTAAALMGLQSIYGVFFVAVADALVDLVPRFCSMRLSRSRSHSAFRNAPSMARDVPYSFARRSRREMMSCIAKRFCCISSSGDPGRSGSGGVRRSSGVNSGVAAEYTGGRKMEKS